MDVLPIDKNTHRPTGLVEDLSSKIWTERYVEPGEFQFKSFDVENVRRQLPEESLVGILESQELMIVENHEINLVEDEDGVTVPELTVTGRSYESFLENRIIAGDYQKPWVMQRPYTTAEALSVYIWNSVVNPGSQDVTTSVVKAVNNRDILPNTKVSDSSTFTEDPTLWWIQSGNIYQSVQDFLSLGTLGIRNIRPVSGSGKIVTVSNSGVITKTTTSNIAQTRMDIYNGIDRTSDQSVVPQVIFTYEQGHLVTPQYLFSSKDYRNHAYVLGSTGMVHVYSEDEFVSGLSRRSLWVDGGTKDSSISFTAYANTMKRLGKVELKKHNRKFILEATISPFSPYKYKEHYDLGDLVTVKGQYGILQDMRVDAYTRTEDKTGQTGYPSLVLPL